jgi:hypothetical protein
MGIINRENKYHNATIRIDDQEFHKCVFDHCTIVYGGGSLVLKDNEFKDCKYSFDGAAARTIYFLQTMGLSASASLDEILKAIRSGTYGGGPSQN